MNEHVIYLYDLGNRTGYIGRAKELNTRHLGHAIGDGWWARQTEPIVLMTAEENTIRYAEQFCMDLFELNGWKLENGRREVPMELMPPEARLQVLLGGATDDMALRVDLDMRKINELIRRIAGRGPHVHELVSGWTLTLPIADANHIFGGLWDADDPHGSLQRAVRNQSTNVEIRSTTELDPAPAKATKKPVYYHSHDRHLRRLSGEVHPTTKKLMMSTFNFATVAAATKFLVEKGSLDPQRRDRTVTLTVSLAGTDDSGTACAQRLAVELFYNPEVAA